MLIHAYTGLGAKDLLNNRMAYVAVSRGAYDAHIFTNDREKLGAALGHDVSHSSAHVPEMKLEQAVTPQREIAPQVAAAQHEEKAAYEKVYDMGIEM